MPPHAVLISHINMKDINGQTHTNAYKRIQTHADIHKHRQTKHKSAQESKQQHKTVLHDAPWHTTTGHAKHHQTPHPQMPPHAILYYTIPYQSINIRCRQPRIPLTQLHSWHVHTMVEQKRTEENTAQQGQAHLRHFSKDYCTLLSEQSDFV